jgi:hypothetical protein
MSGIAPLTGLYTDITKRDASDRGCVETIQRGFGAQE